MASYQKKGGKWRVEVYVAGKRKCKTFALKAHAALWARDMEAELGTEGATQAATDITVGMLTEKYSREVSINKRGRRREQIGLAAIARSSIASIKIQDLRPAHIAEWRDARLSTVSPGSVQRELTMLSGVFSTAVREWGLMAENPVRQITKPRTPPPRDRIFTEDEVCQIVAALKYTGEAETTMQQVALAFLIALETGMRQAEILALKREDVNAETGVALLRQTKNGRPRRVPLSAKAIELFAVRKGGPLWSITPAVCSTVFRKARRAAGIHDATFHDSRHTAITRMASKLTPLELARVVGHTDLKQLLVYFNESAEDLARKLN